MVGQELAVYPGVGAGRDPEFKTFLARNAYRLAVDEPTFAQAWRLTAKISETPYKGRPLGRFIEESMCEATIYFTEPVTGLRLRIRLDAFHPDISFDLKTTRHATTAGFARDAVELSYDLQAFMYGQGRRLYEGSQSAPFVFIAAETAQPQSISTFEAGATFLENGAAKFQAGLQGLLGARLVAGPQQCHDAGDHTLAAVLPTPGVAPGLGIGSRGGVLKQPQ